MDYVANPSLFIIGFLFFLLCNFTGADSQISTIIINGTYVEIIYTENESENDTEIESENNIENIKDISLIENENKKLNLNDKVFFLKQKNYKRLIKENETIINQNVLNIDNDYEIIFNDFLDCYLIYNRALSASEIQQLYREPFSVVRAIFDYALFGAISEAVTAGQVIMITTY